MTENELVAMSELLDKKLQPIQSDISNLTNTINNIGYEVKSIQLTLEKETNRNIMRIVEGHLDLSRKLSETLKIDGEKEMLVIRVNVLENELRQIKNRLATIAYT